MIPPTIEFHRQRHAEHTARLRSERQLHAPFHPRRTLGAWMVSASLRLAPDTTLERRFDERCDTPETDPVSGYASA